MTMSEINWQILRAEFPITNTTAYLNSAAAGPAARESIEAVARYHGEMRETGDAKWDAWLARREEHRAHIARLINAAPDEIAFTSNTSSGMNIIVDALERKGEVISCDLEFPVTTVTWLHRGVKVNFIESRRGVFEPDDVTGMMTGETRIISLSHVQFSNGLRSDLEAIGERKKDHLFVVNASQSVGVLPVDVRRMRIDALCATGHKWLLAGYGTGFLYMSRELLERTRPRAMSWMSAPDPFAMNNREARVRADAAARIEMGVPAFASIFALGAWVERLSEIGVERIEERALALNRYLTGELKRAGWTILSPLERESHRSAETLVQVERPAQAVAHLAARGVAVTEKPQGIRVSTHFFNDEADIARLIEALNELRRASAL